MLEGNNLMFIRAELIEGVSSKTGKDFSICNLTLSDSMESFTLDLDKKIISECQYFKKGDNVDIEIDIIPGYNRNQFLVTNVTKAAEA